MTALATHVRPARLGQPRTITPAAAFLAGTSAGWALTRAVVEVSDDR